MLHNQQAQQQSAGTPEDAAGGDPNEYEDCSFYYELSPCPAYESVSSSTNNQ